MNGPVVFVPPAEITRVRGAVADRYERAAIVADMSRVNALSMIGYAGSGHVGTSLSAMDIVTWLWLEVLEDPAPDARSGTDRYFSSKGHDVPGLYALLIGLGYLEPGLLTRLRRLPGLPGHPDVETPYAITNTGSLGMGISKARGFVRADRLDGRRRRVFVLTGDGELQEGQFWESLQPTANGQFAEITVIVDHNKLQSDTFVRDVSDLTDLEAKIRSFGWAVERCDGHDPRQIDAALRRLEHAGPRPRLLIADTIKGRGAAVVESSSMGDDRLYRFHSGAPPADVYRAAVDDLIARVDARLAALGEEALQLERVEPPTRPVVVQPERLIAAYADELVTVAGRRPDVVALDADLMVDCGLLPFRDRFPERFIECGIAEQDMVSQAGALALAGKLPIVHSFACFLSTRANEQIFNAATERTRIVYHASLAGLLPGGPGHSHQSVRDISAVGSVPGLVLIQPANEVETRLALRWAVDDNPSSTYLRLTSVPTALPFALPSEYRLAPGRGVELRQGTDGLLVGYGPVMLAEVFRAAELLQSHGQSFGVVNLPWLNRIDDEWLASVLEGRPRLFLVEDHVVELGQAATVLPALARIGASVRTSIIGVEGVPVSGQNDEVLAYHGLSAARIAERVLAAT